MSLAKIGNRENVYLHGIPAFYKRIARFPLDTERKLNIH